MRSTAPRFNSRSCSSKLVLKALQSPVCPKDRGATLRARPVDGQPLLHPPSQTERSRLTAQWATASLRAQPSRNPPVHRVRLATLKFARHFSRLMATVAPYAASASAALILWHAASDTPLPGPSSPAPLVYPSRAALNMAAAPAPAVNPPQSGTRAMQQASVAATIVVVGRNDTLDAIFRR